MTLLLDEMWSPEIALQLRRRGHDARTAGRLVTALDALLTTNTSNSNREYWLS